jgi:hypothetical protein
MSFFQKSKILLKKRFTSFTSASALPILSPGVCDHYAAVGDARRGHVETIMLWMIADNRAADAPALL